MRQLLIILTAALLIGSSWPATEARARVGLGDLIEKVTKKDKKDKDKKSEKKQGETTKKRTDKVDNFIDKNNDGVDDRRGRKVVRPAPKETKTAKPKPAPKPAKPKPDSAARKPG